VAAISEFIGIDLGSANLVVSVKGRGIVLNEPSIVACSASNGRVVAVGDQARQLLGSLRVQVYVSRPLRDGAVADQSVLEALLHHLVDNVTTRFSMHRPVVVVHVPNAASSVESQGVLDATLQAGAAAAHLIAGPLAAAIGANVPISNASATMLVDIGGATSEAAIIARNEIVLAKTIRVGSSKIDEILGTYFRQRYGLVLAEHATEQIKWGIGSALPLDPRLEVHARGRDTSSGLPKEQRINSTDVTDGIADWLAQIVAMIREVLDQAPADLAAAVASKGILLTGGGALLRKLDRLLSIETGVPAYAVDDAMTCVAVGAMRALDYFGGTGPDMLGVGAPLPKRPVSPHDYAAAVPPVSDRLGFAPKSREL
jgi:rod shape-determining protein MreB